MDQLQSHIWLTASSYLVKYLRISYIRKPFLYITLHLLHSEFPYIWGKFDFLFYQCTVGERIVRDMQAYNPGINSFYFQKQQFSLKLLSSRQISCNDILSFYLFLICYLPVQKYIPKPFKALQGLSLKRKGIILISGTKVFWGIHFSNFHYVRILSNLDVISCCSGWQFVHLQNKISLAEPLQKHSSSFANFLANFYVF